jgi:hypothetical protein
VVIDKFKKLKLLFEEWRDLPREAYFINNDKLYKEIKESWDAYCNLRDLIVDEYGETIFAELARKPRVH